MKNLDINKELTELDQLVAQVSLDKIRLFNKKKKKYESDTKSRKKAKAAKKARKVNKK